MRAFTCFALFLCWPGVSTPADAPRIGFTVITPAVIQQRLEVVPVKTAQRRVALARLFEEAGCSIAEQPVPHSKDPNVICTLQGNGAGTIVVGGHFDFADIGTGAVDNWSGAALLPSLYQSLKAIPRRHTIVFAGFAAEEAGLYGSQEYVKKLSKEEKAATRAMVNLDSLGTAPPKVWSHRADPTLLAAFIQVAHALQMPAEGSNVENVGDDDSHSFRNAKIPAISFHSVTQRTLPILHSVNDNLKVINPDNYYATYRLVAAYLAYLDAALDQQ